MMERVYVVRLGSMGGGGPYIVSRLQSTWTISFDQRYAHRFKGIHAAEFIASEFGDARPVRLSRRTNKAGRKP